MEGRCEFYLCFEGNFVDCQDSADAREVGEGMCHCELVEKRGRWETEREVVAAECDAGACCVCCPFVEGQDCRAGRLVT